MSEGNSVLRNYGFFNDVMTTLLDRRHLFQNRQSDKDILELCQDLITEEAEAGIFQLASEIFGAYEALDDDGRVAFFSFLNEELDIDREQAVQAAQNYANAATHQNYRTMRASSISKRFGLFQRLNQIPGGTERLVRMRADLVKFLPDHPELNRTDQDFRFLLRSWFNRGFLVMRNITWDSPATLLEKIIQYEAVHKIHNWADLRKRLQPKDRRCFAFFHPAMPEEPLIFVEVALTQGVPESIDAILSDVEETPLSKVDTATFYSISNCQKGLAGVSFGNSLIKQVVRELSTDLPTLKTFVTLSPIPGLRNWTEKQSMDVEGLTDAELKSLVAKYLIDTKHKSGFPLDPVEKFHLGNGASIHKIHANADASEAGQLRSFGAMVNYLYDKDLIAKNQSEFESTRKVAYSKEVKQLYNA